MPEITWNRTKCLFCADAKDIELYPERLTLESFTSFAFSARRKRRREHYRIVACSHCGLVRSDPIVDDNSLAELYGMSEFIFSDEEPYAAKTYAGLLRDLTKHIGRVPASLLEVGCSTGFFLEKALELGIGEVVGFEPSVSCLAHSSKWMRPRIVNSVFEPGRIQGRTFEVVCSFHTIDHLPRPDLVLEAMVESLAPGGHVLIVCHDVESWTAKILRDHSPIFDVEHIYLFSAKTLIQLAKHAKLEIIGCGQLINTYPLGYWLRMAPGLNKLTGLLPKFLRTLPVTLSAGNLYLIAQKPLNPPTEGCPC